MTPSELAELARREFPGWSAEAPECGTYGNVWLWLGDGPRPQTADNLAYVQVTSKLSAGRYSGPYKDFAHAAPLSALEYATGETALSRRKSSSPDLVELVRREFPGFSVEPETGGNEVQYVMWRGSGPKPADSGHVCGVWEASSNNWFACPFMESHRGGFTEPLAALECATGQTALSRRKPDIITRAVEELRAAFPKYTWSVAHGATPETSCIYAYEHASRTLFVQYKSQFVWLAGVTGEALHNWTGSKPCTAFDALIHSNGYRELAAGQTELPRKNFATKPRIDLIPPGVLTRHILPVLHDGAKKHGRDHWRKCTRREFVLAAVTHALAYLDGDETDESGHEALAHAAANLMLALGPRS